MEVQIIKLPAEIAELANKVSALKQAELKSKKEAEIKADVMLSLPSDAVDFVEWILPLYKWQIYNTKWCNRYTLKEETTQSCYEIFKRGNRV